MFNMELPAYCRDHANWREVLSNPPYNLQITDDGDYMIFKYSLIDSDFSQEFVKESRGIILNKAKNFQPVCVPFFKFFNYGESHAATIDWKTARVTEKIDGSLMKVWYDNGWHVSTNGTIDAHKASLNSAHYETFYDLFEAAVYNIVDEEDRQVYTSVEDFFNDLPETSNITYLFELISNENRIVIPYNTTKLFYLTAFNYSFDKVIEVRDIFYSEDDNRLRYIEAPKRFTLTTLNEVINYTAEFGWDREGAVINDEQGNRIKVKSPAYIIAHYSRMNGNISKRHLFEILIAGEKEEFLTYADDYREKLEAIEADMHKIAKISESFYAPMMDLLRVATPKEYAATVCALPRFSQSYLFNLRKEDISFAEYAKRWDYWDWNRAINILNNKKDEEE